MDNPAPGKPVRMFSIKCFLGRDGVVEKKRIAEKFLFRS